ncbi:protein kinase [Streptosporangium subroseum]|uniref:serine/threonine-protein kinase n=1 Tax=Streptosporangium subroseum TaxID=106412 RepID=UPI00344490F2
MSDSQEIIGARYRLLERIGSGGMGTVWRARDEVLGREVAVKEIIPSPDLTGPEREIFTMRTLREARAAGRVGHPGVATVYDVIEEHGRPWIVMQLVKSRTLGAVVREDGPLPPARVAQIGIEVLGALFAAQHVGVLHRDVKPDNVLLAGDGRAVLTDFGIAVLEGDSSLTKTGSLIGTPAFIAPERASGGPAEFASDLWSLGVTLYVAVEGRSPFERAHPLATLSAVMHQHPAPLKLAGSLGPVIFGLLRKDPAERMSAQEAQTHLWEIVNGTAPQPTVPIDLSAADPTRVAAPIPAAPSMPSFAPSSVQDGPTRNPAHDAAPMDEPPIASDPGPILTSTGRRRRPVLLAVMAMALAIAMTSAGMAWVVSNSSSTNPVESPALPSAPVRKTTSENKPEEAKLPVQDDPAPARTRQAPSEPYSGPAPNRSDWDRPAPSANPSGKPTDKPTSKPSGDPSGKPPTKPSGKPSQDDPGKDPGNGSGDSGEGSVDDPGQNADQGSGQDSGSGHGSGEDSGQAGGSAAQPAPQEGTVLGLRGEG